MDPADRYFDFQISKSEVKITFHSHLPRTVTNYWFIAANEYSQLIITATSAFEINSVTSKIDEEKWKYSIGAMKKKKKKKMQNFVLENKKFKNVII